MTEENKKQKFGSMIDGQDVSDFEFDPFNVETSSQIEGSEHLDQTSDICAAYLKEKFEDKVFEDHENTVDEIVASRTSANLINLDVTISADQDHNYLLKEDDCNEMIDEELCAVRASAASLKVDVSRLTEENRQLKEMIVVKNEANEALTATNNSLEDVRNQLASKVKNLEAIKSKYENRLKTYGATIKQMDSEIKQLKARGSSAADKLENDDKVKKVQEMVKDKQKEIKSLQNTIKKKDSVEKELQIVINNKNARISELEIVNNRQQIMYEQAKEIGDKHLKNSGNNEGAMFKGTSSKSNPEFKVPPKKCFYENNGNCREQEKCPFNHPKKTCQSHSKLGSCSQESLCEHRHPQKVCPRLQATGYCSSGDRCRNRHPLEFALNDYSQSTWRKRNIYNNNFKSHFLGSSPHSLQGPGADQAYPGFRATHPSAPREPWSPPFQAGASQGGPPHHPPFSQGRGDHHQIW